MKRLFLFLIALMGPALAAAASPSSVTGAGRSLFPQAAMAVTAAPESTSASTDSTGKDGDLISAVLGDYAPYFIYIAIGIVLLIGVMVYLAWHARPTATPPKIQ